MKNQQMGKNQTPKKRGILTAILLIVAVGIVLFFAVWFLAGNEPAKGPEPDSVSTSPSDKSAIVQNQIAPDEILFSINGKPITMSVFGYFLYDSFVRLENMFKTNELNFSTDMGEGMTLGQYVIKNSVDGIKFNMAVEKLAEELKLDKSKTEAEVDEYLAATIKDAYQENEDSFREQLAMMGATMESFRDIMISQRLGSRVFEHYYGETGTVPVDPSEYYDQFVTASDILLLTVKEGLNEATGEWMQMPLSDEEIAQKRALAESILERLNAGEDFYKLLNEYGEYPGVMPEDNPVQRYTIQRDVREYDFSLVAFSMGVGEYSGIVETSQGYSIIYKLPLDTDRVAEVVKTQEFRSALFNKMLDDISKGYTFEATQLFESSFVEDWYEEYKARN